MSKHMNCGQDHAIGSTCPQPSQPQDTFMYPCKECGTPYEPSGVRHICLVSQPLGGDGELKDILANVMDEASSAKDFDRSSLEFYAIEAITNFYNAKFERVNQVSDFVKGALNGKTPASEYAKGAVQHSIDANYRWYTDQHKEVGSE